MIGLLQQQLQQDRIDDPDRGVTSLMSARQGFRAEPHASRADSRIEQLRVPPQSIEAEQAVLGGLMLDPSAYDRIADQLVDGDFYRRDHQLIYRAIRELAEKNRPYDAVTLGEWFESMGLVEQVAGGAVTGRHLECLQPYPCLPFEGINRPRAISRSTDQDEIAV